MGIAAACLAPVSGQQRVNHAQAAARLKAGNQRFVKGKSLAKPLGEGVRRTLASGEKPYAIIVTSSDSRVVPEHVFNTGLGELFVIRTAGNVCDPHTLASIEYAAESLGTELCVVLGVEGCSAVRLAARNPDQHESQVVSELAERIGPAIRRARREGLTGQDMLAKAEAENAYNTTLECLRRSSSLRALRQAGHFRIVAARYRSTDGYVEWLPERHFADKTHIRPTQRQTLRGLSPHVALRMLQAGHRRFLSPAKATGDISAERRKRMARSEEAIAVVVTCSDSRVAPEHLFDAGLGELYVVRVAGNALNNQVLASIEHAVAKTGASVCVVLGHSNCGLVAAAIEHSHDSKLSPSMRHLLQKIEPAVEIARQRAHNPEELQTQATQINVLRVLAELRSRSRFLNRLEQEGRFSLLPAVYEMGRGDIIWLKGSGVGSRSSSPGTGSGPAPLAPPVGATPAAPGDEALPNDKQPVPVLPKSKVLFEPLGPAPVVKVSTQGRGRGPFLTLLAAFLVTASFLLALLLWQRRHSANRAMAKAAKFAELVEGEPEDLPNDFEDDFQDDFQDDLQDQLPDDFPDEDDYSRPE